MRAWLDVSGDESIVSVYAYTMREDSRERQGVRGRRVEDASERIESNRSNDARGAE